MKSLEYLAGYFDGEGCVTFKFSKKGRCPAINIQVASADKEVLEKFSQRFGGKVLPMTYLLKKTNLSDMFKWRLSDAKLIFDFARQLLPHVIVKHRQLEIALEYAETVDRKHGVKDKIPKRLNFVEELRVLNGIKKTG